MHIEKVTDVNELLNKHIREYKQTQGNFNNFKNYLQDLQIDHHRKNRIITEHNRAIDESLYGKGLYSELLTLQEEGKITKEQVDTLFVLSLEWPYDIHM